MEATYRRSSSRFPAFLALVFLGLISFLAMSAYGHRDASVAHLHRRDFFYGRQEPEPSEPPPSPSPSESLGSSSSTISSSTISSSTVSSSTSRSSSTTSRSSSTSSSFVSSSSTSTSSTSTPSSSTATSSSSLSSSQASESISVSSSTSVPTRVSRTSPLAAATTFAFTDDVFRSETLPTQTDDGSGPEESSKTDSVGATSKGFWANKGAVAAVFVIVSLIAIGLGALLIINLLKKRNLARQRRLHRQLFGEKRFNSDDGHSADGDGSSHGHGARTDVVYDDSRFKGATVTSDYPFAANSAVAASSSQPVPEKKTISPQPPASSHSHTSQQTTYWTPNQSQQTLSTQHQHGNNSTAAEGSRYILPSQSQAQQTQAFAESTSNYTAMANANYYGLNYDTTNYANQTATYGTPAAYDDSYGGITTSSYGTNNYNNYANYSAPTAVATATTSTAPPVAFKNPQVRESYDSFYGYYGKQTPTGGHGA